MTQKHLFDGISRKAQSLLHDRNLGVCDEDARFVRLLEPGVAVEVLHHDLVAVDVIDWQHHYHIVDLHGPCLTDAKAYLLGETELGIVDPDASQGNIACVGHGDVPVEIVSEHHLVNDETSRAVGYLADLYVGHGDEDAVLRVLVVPDVTVEVLHIHDVTIEIGHDD